MAALRICGGAGLPQPAAAYRYVVLWPSQYALIPAIKQASPGIKVLTYKDMASTRDDETGTSDLPTGVSYAYANRYHPEWFLRDRRGRRVNWADWPDYWQMDIGNRAYQRAWVRGVARDLRRRGWDGVLVDGIARSMQNPWYLNGRVLAKYPGPNDYARAGTRFLRRVGPLLRRHWLVVGNINDAPIPLWRRWVGYLSGASKEWWTKANAGPDSGFLSGKSWSYQMQLLRQAQARHKIFIAITYGPSTDARAMDYARASFLMFANGGRSAFTYAPPCSAEPSSPLWREDVGAATGPAAQVHGAWRRDFTGGVAVVNPSPSATVTLPLNGSFIGPNGSVVTSLVLSPHSGFTLHRP